MRLCPLIMLGALAATVACGAEREPTTPSPPALLRLQVAADSLGTGFDLGLTILDASGAAIPAEQLTLQSSAPDIASVLPTGRVIGRAPGTAVVSARRGSDSASVTLRVVPTRIASVGIRIPVGSAFVGDTVSLSAEVRDVAGRLVPFPRIAWSSTTPSVGTVEPDGRFIPRGIGSTEVRATVDTTKGTVPIVIQARIVGAVRVEALHDTVGANTLIGFRATLTGRDGRPALDRPPRWRVVSGPQAFGDQGVYYVPTNTSGVLVVEAELDFVRAVDSVVIVPRTPTRIALESVGTRLWVGGWGYYRATVQDQLGGSFTTAVTAESSDPSVVRATSVGGVPRLEGLREGSASITFRGGGVDTTVTVQVDGTLPVRGARTSDPAPVLRVGETRLLRVGFATVGTTAPPLRWPTLVSGTVFAGTRLMATGDSLFLTGVSAGWSARTILTETEAHILNAEVLPATENLCPLVAGARVESEDGLVLGTLGGAFLTSAMANTGTWQSPYSVMNTLGRFGSVSSNESAWNPRATRPPLVRRGTETLGRLTTNAALPNAISPGAVYGCG